MATKNLENRLTALEARASGRPQTVIVVEQEDRFRTIDGRTIAAAQFPDLVGPRGWVVIWDIPIPKENRHNG
jgi:hypothetical protein